MCLHPEWNYFGKFLGQKTANKTIIELLLLRLNQIPGCQTESITELMFSDVPSQNYMYSRSYCEHPKHNSVIQYSKNTCKHTLLQLVYLFFDGLQNCNTSLR